MKRFFPIILPLLAMLLMGACKSSNLTYFSDISSTVTGNVPVVDPVLTIVPGDELLINVSSAVPEATEIYNLPFNTSMPAGDAKRNAANYKAQTYIVSPEGYINFPVIGKLKVEGLTTPQLADELTRRIAEDVEAPFVRVQLVNFNIKVMGEVSRPGQYTFDTERVTVMDALAKAGDITIYGNRDNVTVWRQENGVATYHHLNLNDSKSMSSPYFYLQQNDMVYVEPGQARNGQANYNQNNSFKISVVSTIVSACSVIASLVIALVINR